MNAAAWPERDRGEEEGGECGDTHAGEVIEVEVLEGFIESCCGTLTVPFSAADAVVCCLLSAAIYTVSLFRVYPKCTYIFRAA